MSYVNVQDHRLPFAIRYFADLISYRHLCFNLVSSDLRSRFRRTRLGILWAVAQPLIFALMLALVWGSLMKVPNYWEFTLYVFTGQVVFEMFSTAVIGGQDSLTSAAGYLKQARIPFLIFQVRIVLTSAVILFFGTVGVFAFSLAVGAFPPVGLHLLLVPAFFGIYVVFLTPIAMLMSVTGLQFRDVKHIAGLGVQGLFLMSPVMMPRDLFVQLPYFEYLNPLVPVLDLYRAPILHGALWSAQSVTIVSVWIVGLWAAAIISSVSAGRRLVYAL
jgi:lipopolysaccharide transport system permease protein